MRRGGLLVVLVVCAGFLAVGCEATPSATVLMIGDSNWPAPYLADVNHWGADHAPLTIIEDWPGLGLTKQQSTYPVGFASQRIAAAEARVHMDYVITNLGVNDLPADPVTYPAAIDALLTAAGTARVIWNTPAVAGKDQPGVQSLITLLDAAATTHPNLWVVHFDALLQAVGACPTVVNGTLNLAPIDSCYVDRAHDVHLSESGRFVLAALTRLELVHAIAGDFGLPDSALEQEISAALS